MNCVLWGGGKTRFQPELSNDLTVYDVCRDDLGVFDSIKEDLLR